MMMLSTPTTIPSLSGVGIAADAACCNVERISAGRSAVSHAGARCGEFPFLEGNNRNAVRFYCTAA
jgi:hypothetical protein